MTKITKLLLCCAAGLILQVRMHAQLSGTYNIPANYPTLFAAISALNSQGINGPVSIEINAGYTETAPAGGFSLTATGTAANPIVFRKTGTGADPLISAYTGGSGTSSSASQDGIWRFIGCDYITVNGIDLVDNNTTNPSTMEYGFGFFKASTSNGCQNNTLINCGISLKTINNAAGSGPAVDGSRGINVVNSLFNSQTTALTPVSFAGTNSNNIFHSNTIANCNVGISVTGYAAASPFTLADNANDIGGVTAAEGNTITNFGGAPSAANAAAGIRTLAQYNLNVSNNVLNNNDGSGANHVSTLRGIYVNTAISANVTIASNTITLKGAGTAVQLAAIENVSGAVAASNKVSINSNVLVNCSYTTNTSGSFLGIYNNGASATDLEINNNVFSGIDLRASTGSNYLIYNTGAVPNSISVSNNQFSLCTNIASNSGAFYGVFNNVSSTASLTMSNNRLEDFSTSATTGATHLIYNSQATSNAIALNSNTVVNCTHTVSSTGVFFGIYNNGASPSSLEIKSNSFINHKVLAFSGATNLVCNTAAIANSISLSNNVFSNSTGSVSSGGTFYGIYNNAGSSANLALSNNTFTNNVYAVTNGSVHLIFNRGAATNTFITNIQDNNIISACSFSASSGGPFLGIYNNGVTSGDLSISNNTIISNSWTSAASAKYLIYTTGAVSGILNLNANSILNSNTANNTTGSFNGIMNTGSCTVAVNACRNRFSNMSNTATTGGTYLLLNSGAVAGGVITMTSNAIEGFTNTSTGLGDFYGIFNSGTTFSSLEISNTTYSANVINSFSGNNGSIYNTGAVSTAISSISINNNLFSGCTNSVSSNGPCFGIYNNAASCANLNLNNNTFTNNISYAVNGANHMIYNRGALTNTFTAVSLNNNLISNCSNSASAGAGFYCIWNNGVTSTVTSISNNTITGSSWSSATALRYMISNFGPAINSANISNNIISNCTHTNNTTAAFYGIYNNNNTAVSSGPLTISTNSFINNSSSATTGETHYINNSGIITNTFASVEMLNNLLAGCSSTVNNNGAFYGLYNNTASANMLNISQNTFTNASLTSSTGSIFFIYNRGVAGNLFPVATFSNNSLAALSHSNNSTGTFYGILNGGAATTSCALLSMVSNSFVNGVSSGTGGGITLMNNACPVTTSITLSNNIFTNFTNSVTTTGGFFAINNGGASPGDLAISNNVFTNLISTASTGNRYLVYNNGGITNSVMMTNNLISSCSHSVSAGGSFYAINNNSGLPGLGVSISNNTLISNFQSSSSNGNAFLLSNSGVVTNTITNVTFTNNLIRDHTNISSSGPFCGIYNTGYTSANLSIVNNTLSSITVSAASSNQQLINNNGRITTDISITDNLITGFTNTANAGGSFYGIVNGANFANGNYPSNLNISNNKLLNNSLNATSGSIFYINNTGTTTNTITVLTITNNLISNVSNAISTTGSWFGIYNSAISSGSLSVNNNTLTNIAATTTTSARYMIYNGGPVMTGADFLNNVISNFTSSVNTSGAYFSINNGGNCQGDLNIINNVISDHSLSATSGTAHLIYNSGVITNTITIGNNLISNVSHTATSNGAMAAIYNNGGSCSNLNISANTLTNSNVYSAGGVSFFIYNRGVSTNTINAITINNNIAANSTYSSTGGQYTGIFNSGTSFGTLGILSNTLLNTISTSTTAPRYYIYNTGAGTSVLNINNNLMSSFTSSVNTTGNYFGINNGGNQQGDLNILQNTFQNQDLAATTGSAFVIYNTGIVTNAINIGNNLVSNFTHSATSSGGFLGLYNNAASSASLSIATNTLVNTSVYTLNGATHFIYNRGAATSTIAAITITDNVVSSVTYSASSGPFYGIFNSATSFSNLSVAGNSFKTINSISTTSPRYFIYNTGAGMGDITVKTNSVSNYTASLNTTGVFYDVLNAGASAGNLEISGNTFSSQVLPATTGVAYCIGNTGVITGSVTLSNNLHSNLTHTSTTGILYGLFNAGVSCSNMSMNSNTLNTISTTNSVSLKYLLYNTSSASNAISISNNAISNYSASLNTTGTFAGIYNTGNSQGNFEANNNMVRNISYPATTGTCYVIYNTGTVSGTADLNNNTVVNFTNTSSGAGTFYGIYNLASGSSSVSMSGNTFSAAAITAPTEPVYCLYNSGTATTTINSIRINTNSISGFTSNLGQGRFYGIFNNTVSSLSLSLSGNTYSNCISTTTGSARYLIYNTGTASGNMNFSNNTIARYTSSVNSTGNFYGIYNSALSGTDLVMDNNSISNNFLESTSGSNYLIYNEASVTNTISLSNNTLTGNTNSTTTSGDLYGIINSGANSGDLRMNGNLFSNSSSAATSGLTYLLHNSGGVTNSISISTNTLGYAFTNPTTDYSGVLSNIYNSGGAPTTSLNVSNNVFTGHSYPGIPGTGNIYFIHNSNDNARYDVSGNSWTSLSLNHNGNEYLIYNPSSTGKDLNVTNNSVTGYTRTANSAALYIYYSNGHSPATCTQVFSGNNFSGIFSGTQGTGSFYGLYNMDGTGTSYPRKIVFNNSISNINYNALGFFYGYYFDFLGDNSSIGSSLYSNTLSAVSWGGPLYGLYVGGNVSSGFAANVYSNTVQNLSSSGNAADIYGAYLLGGGNGLNFYKNKISDLTANGISGKADGVYISNASNTFLFNNLIGNIYTPVSVVALPLNGINIAGGARVNAYYNTVNLNAVGTGSAFGSNALYAAASVSLTLRNNILINTSTPNGQGKTVVYRRSGSLANYAPASNNNLFYAGVPSTNRVLYTDGTNSSQTLPAYQGVVSPRDNASVSENAPFLSTAGANVNFLHINTGIPSLTESGAVNIAGITDDYDGQVRQGNPGYTGAGSAPDIGADEFNQSLIPCSSANAGTVSIPSSSVKCAGETVYLLSTGFTAAGDIIHQWKVSSSPGGPYNNVTGGIGANYVAYTTPTLSAGTYYFVLVTTCTIGSLTGTSNEVTVTVNPAPTATAALASQAICSGQTLNFSASSNSGINYNWQGPNNFTSTAQNPVISNAVTNASGTYTLLISDANCTSSPVFVTATVNPNPPSFSLSPAASSICIGSSQTITASIPISSPTLNFGIQANQNTSSGYPAPYSVYYGGQKMQMLILAGELSAAGFTTGTPIQSIQFPVVALGPNWGATLQDCQNFRVGMKLTTSGSLNAFETGVSNVVPSMNFTPSVGYNNIHNFTSPFIWDGSSNLIVETAFSNSIAGTSGNTVIQYNSPTGFQSTLVYRADNANISAIAAATTSNVAVGFVRPDFKLNGAHVGTYSWSPSNTLSSASGVSVIASPTASSIYSVELFDGQCSSNATVSLDVILVPTITIVSSSPTVCLGNTATLSASGASTYTWSTNSTQTSIVVAPFLSTTYTVNGSNPICPSASSTIFITSAPALTLVTVAAPPVLCIGESSTLTVSGASTYTWTGGANTTSIVITPTSTITYSVTGYDGPGCWTSKGVNVKVNPLPVITISPSATTICVGEPVSVEASGVFSFTWTPGSSNSPILTVSPLITTSYVVVGNDQNNCRNTASISITVEQCTGLSSLSKSAKGISVYPNPSSGIFTVEFRAEGKKEIRIENSLGALLYKTSVSDIFNEIDLSAFAKGVYFIKINTSDISGTYKLIIE